MSASGASGSGDWARSPSGFGRLFGSPPPPDPAEPEDDAGSTTDGDPPTPGVDSCGERSFACDNDIGKDHCVRCHVEDSFDEAVRGRRVCHAVYIPARRAGYPTNRDKCMAIVEGRTWTNPAKRNTFAVARHIVKTGDYDDSHVHIVHVCTTYDRRQSCECNGFYNFRPTGFAIKRRYAIAGAGRGRAILLYLSSEGRSIYEVDSPHGPQPWTVDYGLFPVPCKCRQDDDDGIGHEDACGSIFTSGNCSGRGAADENSKGDGGQPAVSDKGRERHNSASVLGPKASAAILKWFPDSMAAFVGMKEFKTDFPDLYWDKDKRNSILEVAFEDAVQSWLQKPFAEIVSHRAKHANQFLRNFHKRYYSPLFSAQIITRLILEQCDDNAERGREFVQHTLDIMDRVKSKINTLCIIGPASCGKTYFADTLLTVCWKYGKIRNNKKGGDSFTYQDARNSRVVEWNECTLMGQEETETAKQVWEGASVAINCKYKSDQRLPRTPLIVTCNEAPWRFVSPINKQAFLDRAYVHHWSRQPWLKELTMFPCPSMWQVLLENFEDDLWWRTCPNTAEIIRMTTGIHDPNIYFDFWIRKQYPDDTDTEQLLSDCMLY